MEHLQPTTVSFPIPLKMGEKEQKTDVLPVIPHEYASGESTHEHDG